MENLIYSMVYWSYLVIFTVMNSLDNRTILCISILLRGVWLLLLLRIFLWGTAHFQPIRWNYISLCNSRRYRAFCDIGMIIGSSVLHCLYSTRKFKKFNKHVLGESKLKKSKYFMFIVLNTELDDLLVIISTKLLN